MKDRWLKIKVDHLEHCIDTRKVIRTVYNEKTKYLYLYLINKETMEFKIHSESEYNLIMQELTKYGTVTLIGDY